MCVIVKEKDRVSPSYSHRDHIAHHMGMDTRFRPFLRFSETELSEYCAVSVSVYVCVDCGLKQR